MNSDTFYLKNNYLHLSEHEKGFYIEIEKVVYKKKQLYSITIYSPSGRRVRHHYVPIETVRTPFTRPSF